jgi:hypothetical protein
MTIVEGGSALEAIPSATSKRPWIALSCACLQALGLTVAGHSASRNEYASMSQTIRPSVFLTTAGERVSISPRWASSKSSWFPNGGAVSSASFEARALV